MEILQKPVRGVPFILLFLFLPSAAFAQRSVDVSGTVRDEMGKPVASAQLSVQCTRNRPPVQAVSAADGTYSLSNLVVGAYTATVQAPGFIERRIEFTLTGSDDKAVLDVTLAHAPEQPGGP